MKTKPRPKFAIKKAPVLDKVLAYFQKYPLATGEDSAKALNMTISSIYSAKGTLYKKGLLQRPESGTKLQDSDIGSVARDANIIKKIGVERAEQIIKMLRNLES